MNEIHNPSLVFDATTQLTGTAPYRPSTSIQYLKQATPYQEIGPLTIKESRCLLAQLGFMFSDGVYQLVSSDGRVGKYQFDFAALQSFGWVQSIVVSNAELFQQFNWTRSNYGPMNVAEFLVDTVSQDRCALNYANANLNEMILRGHIIQSDTSLEIAGMVAVAGYYGSLYAGKWRVGQETGTNLEIPPAYIYVAGQYAIEVLSRNT